MTAGEWLVGVDLLDLTRVPAAAPLARKILTAHEAVLAATSPFGVYACLALKEAVIKAVGGRPPGFEWTGATADQQVPRDACPAPLVEIAEAAAGAVGGSASWASPSPTYVRCGLDPALASWARARLVVDQAVPIRCTGAWTMGQPAEIFAVILIDSGDSQGWEQPRPGGVPLA